MTRQRNKKIFGAGSMRHSMSSMANLRIFWTLSIFLIIILIGVWVFQMETLAQNSEKVVRRQARVEELSKRETSSAYPGQLTEMDKLVQKLNFEKIDKVHYVRAVESTVLAK